MIKRIAIFLFLCGLTIHASAADFTTTISGTTSIYSKSEFTITLQIKNAGNINAFMSELKYDTTKLEYISSKGLNNFSVVVGTNIVADHPEGKTGDYSLVALTFKALSTFVPGQSTLISILNPSGSDGSNDLIGVSSSITIHCQAPKSSVNTLSTLMVDGVAIPDFKSSTTSYKIIIPSEKTSITLEGKGTDSKSSIIGLGVKEVSDPTNLYQINVRAENGSQKTYTIEVIKEVKPEAIEESNVGVPAINLPKEKVIVSSEKDKTLNKVESSESNSLWFYLVVIETSILFISLVAYFLLHRDYHKLLKRLKQ